jgi:hypothetical protein
MAESSHPGEGRGHVRWGRIEEHYLVCITAISLSVLDSQPAGSSAASQARDQVSR